FNRAFGKRQGERIIHNECGSVGRQIIHRRNERVFAERGNRRFLRTFHNTVEEKYTEKIWVTFSFFRNFKNDLLRMKGEEQHILTCRDGNDSRFIRGYL